MKIQEAIDKRHSIREFEPKPVPKRVIEELIKDASKAPSGKNEQPWRFYIVYSEDKRNLIINKTKNLISSREFKSLKPKIRKIAEKFYSDFGGAPHIILVYREKKKKEPSYQYFNDIAGISSAIQNLMLAAVEKGLGTCWVGTFKGIEKEINRIIRIPKNHQFVVGILLGYPKKGSKPLIRKKKKLNEILKFV